MSEINQLPFEVSKIDSPQRFIAELPNPISPLEDNDPLVSVVLPTYNDAEYIGTAIRSVIEQTYDNIELVIVDSSSVKWLRNAADSVAGMSYLYEPPSNPATARNRGIGHASGDYIAFLDADDFWHPKKLDEQIPQLKGGNDIVYADHIVIEGNKCSYGTANPIEDPQTHYIDFFWNRGVPSRTVVVRAECLEVEKFDERLSASEDFHLWTRLFAEYDPGYVPQPLAYKRIRDDSLTSDIDKMYSARFCAIRDLASRYDEIANQCDARLDEERFRYAMALLNQGRHHEARELLKVLIGGISSRPRHQVLTGYVVSQLPGGHRRVMSILTHISRRLS